MSIYNFKLQDLIKEGRITHDDVAKLKEWLKTQQFPDFSDETLALFSMACFNNFENAKKCAKAYYISKRDGPEIFNDRELTRNDVQHQLKILNFCILPQRTDEGHVIVLHRLVNTDASQYHMEVAMKVLFMTMDTSLYDNPPTGIITLFDMRGVGLRHLTRIKLGAVKKFFYYVQEGLPLALIAIHVFNSVWFLDKILKLVKPFIKPEVFEKINFHPTNINMEDFYEKYLPKSLLPADYGGDLESVQEMQETTEKKMAEIKEYYIQEQIERKV